MQEECLTAVVPEQTLFYSTAIGCLARFVFRSEVIFLGDTGP